MFALTTGTLGLLAVGILILTVTPRQLDSPIAISATTTLATTTAAIPRADRGDAQFAARAPAFAARGSVTTEMATVQHALATPIGDGRMAVITLDARVTLDGAHITVQLPSGRVGSGEVIKQFGDTWLIEMRETEAGHDIATKRPANSEMVTVMNSPPVTVMLANIATLDVHEGTAVLDADGNLIGICTHRRSDGTVRLIELRAELGGATSAGP